jgi:integrase
MPRNSVLFVWSANQTLPVICRGAYGEMSGLPAIPHNSSCPRLFVLHRAEIPASWQRGEILRRTDRSAPRGRRDYAILMLLARLGLRTCEVVRLELEDIDWESGQIIIRGKGGRWSKLPLPPDLGEALAVYLQHDRPRCSTR